MKPVIDAVEEVTPALLTGILRQADVIDDGEVVDVSIQVTKELLVSRVARLGITYSSGSPRSAPSSLFLKLSKPDAISLLKPEVVAAEPEFYSVVGAEMDRPPLIRCYDAAFSAEKGVSHVLLEDLTETHFQPDPAQPPSKVQSEHAIRSLAIFHAYWHDHPKLGNEVGKIFTPGWLNTFLTNLEDSVKRFLDFLGDELSPERRKVYELLLYSSPEIWGRLTDKRGLTVTHGDTHWWNFLYPRDSRSSDVRLFDWQLWHIDLGARDLAFLLALGGFAERRQEMEEGLVKLYYQTLLDSGVQNYPWDVFWNDYRFSAVRNLNIPVIFWSQGRDREAWNSMLDRAFQAYDDLKCEELLAK